MMSSHKYPTVPQQPDLPEIERGILRRWAAEHTFERSVERHARSDEGGREYVFYDGPPFANGLPHYGHLLTGFVKDVVPRYKTMRGYRVERRFGWDCHGLPAEMEAEKGLHISGRANIQAYGIERFNAYCRESVLRYTQEWEAYVTRQARWVDFQNAYRTLDLSYMESVIWAFKRLWDKGLIYEGRRVVPYSWAAETPLSNFEVRLDNSYRPRQDPAITVKFPLEGVSRPTSLLIWTTTPWTLPSNLAIAVAADLEYVALTRAGESVILAAAARERYASELAGWTETERLRGAALLERRYSPPFAFFRSHPHSFRVLAGDFVTVEDGTGIVHLAPGFGEDDQRVCEAAGIDLIVPVDDSGRFTPEVTDWSGLNVFEANAPIIRRLNELGLLFKQATIDHNYPHCWRTDTPLIYRAIPSWFVRASSLRERMGHHNSQIHWMPEHIRDGQFGKWLENARDWSISRNRFWGSPIPVWQSDDPAYPRMDVYGSLDEIEKDFGARPSDLHRPFVDELVRVNPDDPTGRSRMRRVSEVLDCWFESGAMPFAQVHYPFEKKEWFERHFPADFVVEYIGQTRGWFYTMVALATALFDKPPFRNVICHGVVLDSNGHKLSKKLRNYADPMDLCERYGADALRWSLMRTAILRGADVKVDGEGRAVADAVRLVLHPIWNAYYFLTLYANSEAITPRPSSESGNVLDRYILGKLRLLIGDVTRALDGYDISGACKWIEDFLDAMNNWYIRRSRPRFWNPGGGPGAREAFDTLHTVLVGLCRVAAPLLPLLTEEIYRGLTGEPSVHLCAWPSVADVGASVAEVGASDAKVDRPNELIATMDHVRAICSAALSIREAKRLRTRLPLRALTVAGRIGGLAEFTDIIADEVNVKRVVFSPEASDLVERSLAVKANVVGARLGPRLKDVLVAAKAGRWSALGDGRYKVQDVVLSAGDVDLTWRLKPGVAGAVLDDGNTVIVLDTVVTPDLSNEGIARDLVRLVQSARKNASLSISDRIELWLELPRRLVEALTGHLSYVAQQTLATRVDVDGAEGPGDAWSEPVQLDGERGRLWLRKQRASSESGV